MGRQAQEGLRILCTDILAEMPDYRLVTAHFHVLPRQRKGQPHQRVEPVQAQGGVAQQLPQGVVPPDVVPFVGNDEGALSLRGFRGQVHFGPQNTQDKGCRNVIGKINFLPVRGRAHQPVPQRQVLNHAVNCHDGRSCQPDICGDLQNGHLRLHLFRFLIGYRLLLNRRDIATAA